MASLTPNLGLVVWGGADQFSNNDLSSNWNAIDDAFASLLSKTDSDTLAGAITVTGSLAFGATDSVTMVQTTLTDTPSNYKALRVGGTLYCVKANVTDTAFGVKIASDSESDDALRVKIRADGRVYFGNGSAHDVVLMRDATGSLAVQYGSDIDSNNPSMIVGGVTKIRKYQGPSLNKTNLVWNPDFEINNSGWSVAGLSSVTAAATSITSATSAGTGAQGSKMGTIVAPGSNANEGATFPIYRKFQAGTPYNIRARVYSASSTANVQIGIGASGIVYESSTPQALSSTWSEITLSWTPSSTVDVAHFFVRLPGTAAVTFAIDEVKVYAGSLPTFTDSRWAIAESFPRWAVEVDDITPLTTQQYIVAIPVEKGMVASRMHLLAGNASSGVALTDAEAGLYSIALDSNFATGPSSRFLATRLAQSPTLEFFQYQGPYAPITWELATPYRFNYTGLAYLGFVFTGTPPLLAGRSTISGSGTFSIRGYHWYPLIGTLGTGTPVPSSSLVGYADPAGIGRYYPYAWLS